jgi:hypothetical protein
MICFLFVNTFLFDGPDSNLDPGYRSGSGSLLQDWRTFCRDKVRIRLDPLLTGHPDP